jgi:hypothetical protein
MVTLEKEYSSRAGTRKLVLPEASERRVSGSLNLRATSKGPMCYFFRVY